MEDIVHGRYNIYKDFYARFVIKEDAVFINTIRHSEQLSKFISKTEDDVNKQEKWIEEYKEREKRNEEYYFIVENDKQEKFGTVRIYNIIDNNFESGSWVFKKNSPDMIAIRADMWVRDFAFRNLELKTNNFEVRKANKHVIMYHKLYNPNLIKEDELNYYYILEKDGFYKKLDNVKKLLFSKS